MLFKKVFIFLLMLLVFERVFHQLIIKRSLPPFWGNEELYEKLIYVKNSSGINTVFIGSSKIKRQIMPYVFDSTTRFNTTSFNLGCNGLFIPESFQVLNYLLDSGFVKNIIYEIRPAYHIYPENLHITRTIYYHTLNNYIKTLNNCFHSNLPLKRKLSLASTFSIAHMESELNFNFTQGFIDFKSYNLQQAKTTFTRDSGFVTMGNGTSDGLLNSSSELLQRAMLSKKYNHLFLTDSLYLNTNTVYLKIIQQMIEKARRNNIKLFLLYPPALREFEYQEILPLLKKLKGAHIINLSDVGQYPEFYQVKYNYETDHLNTRGSYLFSVALANEFNKQSNACLNILK